MNGPWRVMEETETMAPLWKRVAARLFGERVEGRDYGAIIVGYRWRGVIYISRVGR